MAVTERMEKLAGKIRENSGQIDEPSIKKMIKKINSSKRIFLTGAGRSGYVAKAFAMRLMHLGFDVHVVGEATTPAITNNDLLIAVSGSGETYSTVGVADAAKRKKAAVMAITSNPKSRLAASSGGFVLIKGRSPEKREKDYLARQLRGFHEPLAPLGTLFELSTMVFFDSLVEELMVIKKRDEEYLRKRHTELE